MDPVVMPVIGTVSGLLRFVVGYWSRHGEPLDARKAALTVLAGLIIGSAAALLQAAGMVVGPEVWLLVVSAGPWAAKEIVKGARSRRSRSAKKKTPTKRLSSTDVAFREEE